MPFQNGYGELKPLVWVCSLTLFWLWETWLPLFRFHDGRLRHAARNVAIALGNAIALGVLYGAATIRVTDWTATHKAGLLNTLPVTEWQRCVIAFTMLDAWMYVWHRANHAIPWLWRFHRMHHSDRQMDVTSAARFHLGEHVIAGVLRIGLIVALGLQVSQIVLYEVLLIAMTHFHHANISIGRVDRWLRLVIVTPDMHKVHHSRQPTETDSNYSTVLSIWDRIAVTYCVRHDPSTIQFGLDELNSPRWQTIRGMLQTPFLRDENDS